MEESTNNLWNGNRTKKVQKYNLIKIVKLFGEIGKAPEENMTVTEKKN